MERKLKRNIGVCAGGAAVVCLVLYGAFHGNTYSRRDTAADSAEVRESLAILRNIAADPGRVPEYMAEDAKGNAHAAVARAAELMGEAQSIELKEVAWFGEYLQVGVTCPRAEGKAIERYFFLRREKGELRVTGLQF
ncbi:MAG: hypothetical protein ACYTFZ_05030 [Planctomycetota bacterium]|jgi:hypothetical protein